MNELTYTQNGDYLIPNLTLGEQPTQPIGKYGHMRKTYLQERRPALFSSLFYPKRSIPIYLKLTRPPTSGWKG